MEPVAGTADGAARLKRGAQLAGLGSRVTASKSMTPSNKAPVRIKALTCCRCASAAGGAARNGGTQCGRIVAPMTRMPRARRRSTPSLNPSIIAAALAPFENVVDPLEPDDGREPRYCEHVTIEPRECRRSAGERSVRCIRRRANYPIAADTRIDDRHASAIRPMQPLRQHVRPTIVAIERRAGAIGNRVAEASHHIVDSGAMTSRASTKYHEVVVFGNAASLSSAPWLPRPADSHTTSSAPSHATSSDRSRRQMKTHGQLPPIEA